MMVSSVYYVVRKCYVIVIFLSFHYLGPGMTFYTLSQMLISNLKSKIYSYVMLHNYVTVHFYIKPKLFKIGLHFAHFKITALEKLLWIRIFRTCNKNSVFVILDLLIV